jgi:hypothetical protein
MAALLENECLSHPKGKPLLPSFGAPSCGAVFGQNPYDPRPNKVQQTLDKHTCMTMSARQVESNQATQSNQPARESFVWGWYLLCVFQKSFFSYPIVTFAADINPLCAVVGYSFMDIILSSKPSTVYQQYPICSEWSKHPSCQCGMFAHHGQWSFCIVGCFFLGIGLV